MTHIDNTITRRLFSGLCLCLLAGILVAGLWPFTPRPHNDVSWIANQNGLLFGEHGSILSSAPLRVDGPPDGPCSLELWLQPGLIDDSNTMLAFQTPETPLQFGIRQNNDALMLTRQAVDSNHRPSERLIYIKGVFKHAKPLLITVTSGANGTAVYLNGNLIQTSADFGLTRHELNGGIVVGNSPIADDSWSGVLRGVGIYNQELTSDQVRRDFDEWTDRGQPSRFEDKNAVAVYSFAERSGTVVHNLVPSAVDLQIPDHYLVLYPPFLTAFWKGTAWGWGFWKNALINVGGFVPLGFCFCVYFSQSMPVRRALLLTILFGFAVSLLIEVTQYFLPTRDSGSWDLINNTLGTIIGALMCLPGVMARTLARFGIGSLEDNYSKPTVTAAMRPNPLQNPS